MQEGPEEIKLYASLDLFGHSLCPRFLDQDGNGWISHDELRTAMTTQGDKMDDAEFERVINELDADRDGKIYYEGNS